MPKFLPAVGRQMSKEEDKLQISIFKITNPF
jgi:hypothetical protein